MTLDPELEEFVEFATFAVSHVSKFCGGKGGKPGPCPSGVKDAPAGDTAAKPKPEKKPPRKSKAPVQQQLPAYYDGRTADVLARDAKGNAAIADDQRRKADQAAADGDSNAAAEYKTAAEQYDAQATKAKESLAFLENRHAKGMRDVFGADQPDVASMVGAPDNASVAVTAIGQGYGAATSYVGIKVDHPDYSSIRRATVDADGKKVMVNDSFFMKPGKTGSGLGTQVLQDQIDNLRESGFDRMETHAAKGQGMNGYYTWPRMGYDQEVSKFPKRVRDRIAKDFPDAKSVQDIMTTPQGREWWKKKGFRMEHAVFDLKDGSRSLAVHEAYLEERAKRSGAKGVSQSSERFEDLPEDADDPSPISVEQANEIELEPWEEEAMEAAWARLDEPAQLGEDPDRITARLDDQVADTGDVALASPDGRQAEQLLTRSRVEGAAVLADVTRRALKRWLGMGGAILGHTDKLFNDVERMELQQAFVAVNGTAELLGRSRIRLRLDQARKRYTDKFVEEFCGGPGSGRPGPCPSGVADAPKAVSKFAPKKFKTLEEMKAWGKESFDSANFTQTQKESLRLYSGDDYWKINGVLRGNRTLVDYEIPTTYKIEDVANQISEGLSKAETTEDVVAYRGMRIGPVLKGHTQESIVGATFQDSAFTSTSLDKKRAAKFTSRIKSDDAAILEVRIPKGSQAAYVSPVSSFGKDEQELLINRGAKFRVIAADLSVTPKKLTVELVHDAQSSTSFASLAEDDDLLDRFAWLESDIVFLDERANVDSFADDPTDWSAFADGEELKPLEPAKALEFFRRKVTLPGITAQDLTQRQNQRAFTLAVNAEVQVLDRVRGVILDSLAAGKTVTDNTRTINKILSDAGIVETVGGRPVGGAYSEMIWRTNMLESYRHGAQEELAEVAEDFPVWRYVGIDDGRQRARHRVNFNLYYPSSVRFEEVRDLRAGQFDGYNCRCDFIPIARREWMALRAGGARVAPGYQDPLAA